MKIRNLIGAVCLTFILGGCAKENVITDPYTLEKIEYVDLESPDIVIDHRDDGMARQSLEFSGIKVVVNPNYYDDHEIKRGDISLIDIPTEAIVDEFQQKEDIIRVIALEGEKISIRNSQIYINGSRLKTFYGKLLAYGLDKNQYSKIEYPGCEEECRKSYRDYFETEVKEIAIPTGYIFVLGDNSFRSVGSLNFGPLSKSLVKGKVIGYLK
ncbi:signal peptidase I [Cohnella mopanensis]|uniref:signal peptidase I n=1 Tax=Cohnella mopanensis TaxID=2911966 RepID=UPI001EF7F87B|nr:signal peptidase I [Cohnella mopanensis]